MVLIDCYFLQLYPYHLSDVVVKGLRITPFSYYCDMMLNIITQEKSYDSLPNFTAADCKYLISSSRWFLWMKMTLGLKPMAVLDFRGARARTSYRQKKGPLKITATYLTENIKFGFIKVFWHAHRPRTSYKQKGP